MLQYEGSKQASLKHLQHTMQRSSYLSATQRQSLITAYMNCYTDWYNDEPDIYETPDTRTSQLNSLNNSELYKFIQSDCPSLLE